MLDVDKVCSPLPDAEELETPDIWKLPEYVSCPEPATSERAGSRTLLKRLNDASRERAPASRLPQPRHLQETSTVRI